MRVINCELINALLRNFDIFLKIEIMKFRYFPSIYMIPHQTEKLQPVLKLVALVEI